MYGVSWEHKNPVRCPSSKKEAKLYNRMERPRPQKQDNCQHHIRKTWSKLKPTGKNGFSS